MANKALREYPVRKPSSAPSTGRILYEFLIDNLRTPSAANHLLWYSGEGAKLPQPEKYAFRGDIPIGESLELISIAGKPLNEGQSIVHKLDGTEPYIQVSDLAPKSRLELNIPETAKPKDKVYNPNFKPFDQLDPLTKMSNELASLSVVKSISSYLGGVRGKVNYSEKDVLSLLSSCFTDLSSPEMMHFLHGNHLAWAALEYVRTNGNVTGNIRTEFHGQNTSDFYQKDLGTILPAMFFALANLGQDPVEYFKQLDIEVWAADKAAEYMRQFMPK